MCSCISTCSFEYIIHEIVMVNLLKGNTPIRSIKCNMQSVLCANPYAFGSSNVPLLKR